MRRRTWARGWRGVSAARNGRPFQWADDLVRLGSGPVKLTTTEGLVARLLREDGQLAALACAGVGTYARPVTTTADRLRDTREKIDSALASVRADQGASPVLIAVLSEFAKKAEKA